jgi:hypothetical protein
MLTFCDELVDYGDKMVQRVYKTSYMPDDFLKDMNKQVHRPLPWPILAQELQKKPLNNG